MDEEVEAGQETEAPSEGETGDPSPESQAEPGDQGGAEDETPQGGRRDFRDDVYRIARGAEQAARENSRKLDEFMAEVRASRTQAGDKSDPVAQRAALATDPLRVIRETAKEEGVSAAREEFDRREQERQAKDARDLLLKDYPELKNANHPFFAVVEEEYNQLVAEGNSGPGLPRLAAKMAAARSPELRDQGMKDSRKKAVENGTKKVAATTKVESGVTKPKGGDSSQALSKKDHEIARRFGMDLSDEKQKAKFLKFRDADRNAMIGGYPSKPED